MTRSSDHRKINKHTRWSCATIRPNSGSQRTRSWWRINHRVGDLHHSIRLVIQLIIQAITVLQKSTIFINKFPVKWRKKACGNQNKLEIHSKSQWMLMVWLWSQLSSIVDIYCEKHIEFVTRCDSTANAHQNAKTNCGGSDHKQT